MDGLDTVIGTTGRGIGPTYADKINRIGVRFGDVVELLADDAALSAMAERMTASLAAGGLDEPITAASLHEDLAWVNATYASSIANTGLMLDHALSLGERIILEGAQGCLLDIDQGTYPFVTSSVTSRGNATHGAGIHPGHVDEVIGITKAYICLLYTSPSPRDVEESRMPSSA